MSYATDILRAASNNILCAAREIDQLSAEKAALKAELKSIDSALNDPRANLTLTTAEVILEIKAELAEAKVDASNDCATCTYASLKEREIPCSKCVQEIKVYTNWKAAKGK